MSADECSSETAPKIDNLLQTLSNSVRREIINYFETCTDDPTASLSELVDHVETRLPAMASKDLWVLLTQDHLPTLQNRGWLEFDQEGDTVLYHGHDHAEQFLRDVLGMFET